MPKKYNLDLKNKILEELNNSTVHEIAKKYSINVQTIYLWKRNKESSNKKIDFGNMTVNEFFEKLNKFDSLKKELAFLIKDLNIKSLDSK